MSEENEPKVLEKTTEKISFLKRVTHIKIEIYGNVLEEKIEHYAKPIDALIAITDYLGFGYVKIEMQDIVIKRWVFPFQSTSSVFASAFWEAFAKVKEEKGDLEKK